MVVCLINKKYQEHNCLYLLLESLRIQAICPPLVDPDEISIFHVLLDRV